MCDDTRQARSELANVDKCSLVCFAFFHISRYAYFPACVFPDTLIPDMLIPDMRIFSTRNRHIFQTNLFLQDELPELISGAVSGSV